MQAKFESDLVQEAIRVITRLAPPMSGAVTMEAKEQTLKFHSQAELSRCSVLLPGDVSGDALFAVPTESISAAVKGHKEIEFSCNSSMLKLKAGTYSTSLTTMDALELEIEEDKSESKIWKVSAEQLIQLKAMVTAVAMKPVANMAASFMPVSVKLTPKGSFVACYDANRMCFTTNKELTGDLDVTLPIEMLSAVLDAFKNVTCKIKVTDSLVYVKNRILDVALALPATDEDVVIDTAMVQEKAREVRKVDGKAIEADKKAVMSFMDNARAVATKERSELQFKTEPGKLTLSVKTTNGVSRTVLKSAVKAKLDFKCDFEFFDETLKKCPDQLLIKFVDDAQAFIMVKAANNTYSLIALNQD